MQMQRSPYFLAHDRQADEDDRGDHGPNHFESIISVRVRRAFCVCRVAILPNHPAQANLRRCESHANDDDGDHELAVDGLTVLSYGFRKPPTFADEHPNRAERYDPDGYSKNASHRLSPSS